MKRLLFLLALVFATTALGSTKAIPASCDLNALYRAASPGTVVPVTNCNTEAQKVVYDASKASATQRVAFDASGQTLGAIELNGAQHIEFRNFNFTGRFYARTSGTKNSGAANDIRAKDVLVTAGSNKEVLIRNSDDVSFTNGAIGGYNVDNGGVPKVGGYASRDGGYYPTTNVLFSHMFFHDVTRTSQQSSHAECLFVDGGTNGVTVEDSVFTNCAVFSFFCQTSSAGPTSNITLQNNMMDASRGLNGEASGGSAIDCKGGSTNLKVLFNSLLGNVRVDGSNWPGLYVNGNAVGVSGTACTLVPVSAVGVNVVRGTKCGPNDIQADPFQGQYSFASCKPANVPDWDETCYRNDTHLTTGSPAVDVLGAGPPDDIDVQTRPQGNSFDAGADELASLSGPPAPLSILVKTATTVTIGWTKVFGATKYSLYRDGVFLSTAGINAIKAKFGKPAGSHTYTIEALGKRATLTVS